MAAQDVERQKQLRAEHPSICWAFVSSTELCFLTRPCRKHDEPTGPYIELAMTLLNNPEVIEAVAKALQDEGQ